VYNLVGEPCDHRVHPPLSPDKLTGGANVSSCLTVTSATAFGFFDFQQQAATDRTLAARCLHCRTEPVDGRRGL
jgi:hypothetical protein